MSEQEERKIVLLGSGATGKSCLCVQFVSNAFLDFYDPTIEDAYRKQFAVDGKICIMDILDTAGQEEYSAMRDMYMRGAEAFIVCYDLTNRRSFDALQDEFLTLISRCKDAELEDIPIVLVGNKCDLEHLRQVPTEDGESLARSIGAKFMEASGKTRHNVESVFSTAVRLARAADKTFSKDQNQVTKKKSTKKRGFKKLFRGLRKMLAA